MELKILTDKFKSICGGYTINGRISRLAHFIIIILMSAFDIAYTFAHSLNTTTTKNKKQISISFIFGIT